MNVQNARLLARYQQNVGNVRAQERFLTLPVKWWNAIFAMGEGSSTISAKNVMEGEKLHVTPVVERVNLHLTKQLGGILICPDRHGRVFLQYSRGWITKYVRVSSENFL